MRGLYCCADKSVNIGFKSVGDVLADSSKRIALMVAEQEKKLAEIKSCPGPCTDGKVAIKAQTIGGCPELKVPCPVISQDCAYGIAMQRHFDRYLAELMVANIGVPRRLVARMGKYVETIAIREAASWGTQGFLVLSGKTGCGKSYAAAWLVYRRLKSCIEDAHIFESSAWENWRATLESAASGITWLGAQNIVEDRNVAANAKRCPLLILDDLGKESGLESAQAVLRDVVAKRYDNELPTIITTELTVTDIETRYGRAIAERIVGELDDGGLFVTCGDASLRLVKG